MKRIILLIALLAIIVMPTLANDSTYLNFTAMYGTATVQLVSVGNPDSVHLQYSTDSVTWNTYTIGDTITLAEDAKLYFKALTANATFCQSPRNYYKFVMTGSVSADGNLMSLLDATMTQDTVPEYCFCNLFKNCVSLTQTPALPASQLANSCYLSMFSDCSSLEVAQALPATTMAHECYCYMFKNCTSLYDIPALPAMNLADNCYSGMFYGCDMLYMAPALPATTLAAYCYNSMFENCSTLISAPALPATTLSVGCYSSMFSGCTSLALPPILRADSLPDYCYDGMFSGCSSLEVNTASPGTQWIISSRTTGSGSLDDMFQGTSGTMHSTPTANTTYFLPNGTNECVVTVNCNDTAMGSVTGGGVFTYNEDVVLTAVAKANYNFIGWSNGMTTPSITVNVYIDTTFTAYFAANTYAGVPGDSACLNFTAVNGSATVQLKRTNFPDVAFLLYSKNHCVTWQPYIIGNSIFLYNNEKVYFKALNSNSAMGTDYSNYYQFVMSGTVAADGNIVSLLDPTMTQDSVPQYAFFNLFSDCRSLTVAPTLPATRLADYCYGKMFFNCSSLKSAPLLPATTLAERCYSFMFQGCTSLATPPLLPATSLAEECYANMFYGCSSLSIAPALPATSLADKCYMQMFENCTSLAVSPCLPATTLTNRCYDRMFAGCSTLTVIPVLPATTLTNQCYDMMFSGCTSLIVNTQAPGTEWKIPATTTTGTYNPLNYMFFNTGGTMSGTPSVNTNYYLPNGASRYSVMVSSNDTTMGTVKGNGFYDTGDSVTIIALPKAQTIYETDYRTYRTTGRDTVITYNYSFVNWSNGDTTDTIKLTVQGDTALTATFACYLGYQFTEKVDVCYGDSLEWRGRKLAKTGYYYDSLLTNNGKDSVYKLILNIHPNFAVYDTAGICQGESYDYQGETFTPSEAGEYDYPVRFKNIVGCDSIYYLHLVVHPTYYFSDTAYIKYGETYSWHDQSLTTAGTYTYNQITRYGCDSVRELVLITKDFAVSVNVNDSIMGSVTGGGAFDSGEVTMLIAKANTHYHFVNWSNGVTTDTLRITVISDTTLIAIFAANEYAGVPGDSACLNFTAVNGLATIKLNQYIITNPIDLLYSTNNCTTWHYYTIGNSVNLANGSKVYFKALNVNDSSVGGCEFVMTGTIAADGSILSLLDASMNTTSIPSYAFSGLFRGCSSLTRAPELSATTLDSCCYMNMFDGCTSLTYVPALSATTMGYACCEGMFRGCTALTQTPTVSASTMGDYCCAFMFQNCTALTQASTISADSMGDYCCYQMFKGFTSLQKMSALSANSVGDSCCFEMFKGCSSLTQAPLLPATNLGAGCYNSMFDSCTSLTHAPALPATTMADCCYSKMFSGCTSLVQAPQLPALNLAMGCYYSMFDSCISLIQAPPLPATTLADWCYEDMFRDCSSLIKAPALPATNLSYGCCYCSMFLGCSSLIVNEQGPGAELTIPYFYLSPHVSAVTGMFDGTAGTMNGTPSENTTYYFPNGVSRYLVSVDVNDTTMGTFKGSGFYDTGDTVVIIALPKPNHHFVSWSNGTTNDTITLRVSGDTTLIATFAYDQNYFFEEDTIVCDSCLWHRKTLNRTGVYYDSLKTVYGSDSVYKLNLTVNPKHYLTETHSMNYGDTYSWHNKSLTAAGVYYDSLTTQAGCDSIYELTLTLYKYTVTVNSNDTTMGSVSGGGVFDYGNTTTLIATAKPHYHLVHWSNGATTDTITIAVTGDTTLTATFAIDQHTVTVNSNDTTMGSVTGGGTFNYGDIVTLTATANANHHFDTWSNGVTTPTVNITVTSDTTLTATFEADAYGGVISGTLYWSIDTVTGELSFTGSGSTGDYTPTHHAPWYYHRSDVEYITMPSTYSSIYIGDYALDGLNNLFYVRFRADSLGSSVFNGCNRFKLCYNDQGNITTTKANANTFNGCPTTPVLICDSNQWYQNIWVDTLGLNVAIYPEYSYYTTGNNASVRLAPSNLGIHATAAKNSQRSTDFRVNDNWSVVWKDSLVAPLIYTFDIEGAKYIGKNSFVGCENLSDINIKPSGNSHLDTIHADAFDGITPDIVDLYYETKYQPGNVYGYTSIIKTNLDQTLLYVPDTLAATGNNFLYDYINTPFWQDNFAAISNKNLDVPQHVDTTSADAYFYYQDTYDTIPVVEYHLVLFKVGGTDTADIYFSNDTTFTMRRIPRIIVIVDSVSGTTTTVTISINHAAFNNSIDEVNVHMDNLAPNSTYSITITPLDSAGNVLDYDSCSLTTTEYTSVSEVYEDIDDFYPTDQTDVYTLDGRYIGKYYLDLPPGVYIMREKGRWYKFGKVK